MSVVAAQAVAGGGNVDPIHAVLLHSPEILSHTFLYAASIKDVPAIARTCSNWKSLLSSNTSNVDDIWKNLCSIHHPNLLRLHTLCNFSNNGGNTWRQLLRRRMTSPYEPIGSNRQLQRDLETVFRPEGILAFSNCCGACFDAYEGGKDDDDEDDNETKDKNAFKFREDGGIHFFKLFLNGMNYMGNFHPHRGFAAVAGHAVYKVSLCSIIYPCFAAYGSIFIQPTLIAFSR